ncbi:unnamed protein product, partial [Choristocarpus tenellus]
HGRGAVTPALLPTFFPEGAILSEGVKMVLSGQDSADSLSSDASAGAFSVHSTAVDADLIIKVTWDHDSAVRLGVLPKGTSKHPFQFRVENLGGSSGGGSIQMQQQLSSPPEYVMVAVLHAGGTVDVGMKLVEPVPIPVGRW